MLAVFLLATQLEAIAAAAHGHVGAAVRVLETGESAGIRRDEHFHMQSVYKLPIAMAVLREIERGHLQLDQPVRIAKSELVPPGLHSPIRDQHPEGEFAMPLREILRYAISESDGTASDVLLRLAGGPDQVTEYIRSLGVHDLTVATSEVEMSRGEAVQYRNWSTPDAMLELLAALQTGRGITPSHRTELLRWMTEGPTGPKRIKGLLPPGTVVAHKTGTSGTAAGLTRATNDVGIVTLPDGRHLLIAVFVSDSSADPDIREGVIAKIARAAWDAALARR